VVAAQQSFGNAMTELLTMILTLYGNRHRDFDVDPDKSGGDQHETFPDDAPILASFRESYNQLQSWKLFLGEGRDASVMFAEIRPRTTMHWEHGQEVHPKEFKERFRTLANTNIDEIKADYEALVQEQVTKIQGLQRSPRGGVPGAEPGHALCPHARREPHKPGAHDGDRDVARSVDGLRAAGQPRAGSVVAVHAGRACAAVRQDRQP